MVARTVRKAVLEVRRRTSTGGGGSISHGQFGQTPNDVFTACLRAGGSEQAGKKPASTVTGK